jgi:hypothetical protein
MLALPTLTLSAAAAHAMLRAALASRVETLREDGLDESPEAEDIAEALDLLASEPERYPHTVILPSSNALRVIAQSRDDLIADGALTPFGLILTDEL